ncbi:Ubiquitin carboxyl-terminal hydrolase family protein [Coccidioides posadasii C735 delta SOWgp]|uniref:ubiquitinyl hydrolase 1 n=1 Tax=Coccidioides posadasii (strain C735) TaxID=222929 RepID=C5P4N4_COCP7|nr:Ubiquitin carboxyl-terminal hydrolase family protein [Coccidioides posadasii C735 delta SOWgp]EER27674.1 Ubiquitin carboxyl-terminal hydrolase family protein [Coccidioides posadasii C735 delta SOWgp]|eukprot:XP_003069819.1 Ubiquitin carboxyl-terminal hydrolase family protein [Coccidioides posadasii C735 delta SOWgp]
MDNLEESGMVVDEFDQYSNDHTDDVVLVSPSGSPSEPEPEFPLADDYESMITRVLPELPDTETLEQTHHTWHIQNWTRMERKEHGPIFECGGSPWRVLFFPFGNQVTEYASFYLEHGYEEAPPEGWSRCVQFALVLWSKNNPSIYVSHVATHRFNASDGDWGFTRFCELRKLFHGPFDENGSPLIENEEACLTVYMRVVKDPTGVLWHSFKDYDSKKETGMVGLKNQGATCYLNSLLQSLYFTNSFRKAVYQIPTEEDSKISNSAWTLQRLFYSLQTSDNPVSTQELTSSFGWESKQIFEQQDVQELCRKLMERLEEKMKGTPVEKALHDLFVGKTKTYISCINVDYESSRIEDFWDIQLNVRGNKTLDDSFKDYIQVETLEGENKYDAGDPYGLQDAKKGVIFESFPPVLHLHLKRFEYDIHRDAMMKINDRHEFPEEFDASPYLSENADRSEPWVYQLYGVLVHTGELNAGHYYAFLRPTKDGYFYRFDDDRVVRATMKQTLEENFGGDWITLPNGNAGMRQAHFARGYSTKRSMNAYMLVYLRKSRVDDILVEVMKNDVPCHIEKKIAEERAELARRKKEREEQHLYMNVSLISDESFKHHHSFDLTSPDLDPNDPAAPKAYRILRATKVGEFAKQVAEEREVAPEQVRLWVMVNRQNKTTRPDQHLRDMEMSMEQAFNEFGTKNNPFRLWLEIGEPGVDGKVSWPDSRGPNAHTLIFLKYFDVHAQTLTGVKHVFVRKHAKVSEISGTILELMNWAPGTSFLLYEEIRHSMIDPMKPKHTFHQSEIQDGDIICFQRSIPESELPPTVIYRNVQQYYDFLLNRILVTFAPIEPNPEQTFTLTLSKKMTYEQFSTKVGEHLKVEPTHLRFAPVIISSGAPKPFIKRNVAQNLGQMLTSPYPGTGYSHRSDVLYYEILETSLSEFEMKKNIKITWLSEGIAKEQIHEVLVAKNGVVSDVIESLQKKANIDDETIRNVRLYEAYSGKIYKELYDTYSVAGITDYVTVFAERIPEDELNMQEGEFRINAFNFDKEPQKAYGCPFKFVVKPGEKFKDTKERLSKRTGIKGKQFERIKFALVSRTPYSKPLYLEDDHILADLTTDSEQQLGLDHVNKNRNFWGRSESFFIR